MTKMKQLLTKLDNVLAYMSVFSKYPLCLYALKLQMLLNLKRFQSDAEMRERLLNLKRFQSDDEIPYGLSTNIPELQSWIDNNINSK